MRTRLPKPIDWGYVSGYARWFVAVDYASAAGGNWRAGLRIADRRGFTIIELLVVLAIIGLLTSLAFTLFSTARAKSRDTKREKDVKVLQDALSIYVTNSSTYPTTDASGLYLTGSDAVSAALLASGAITAIPSDSQNVGNFRYHYRATDGFTYTLTYYLETNSIPGKSAGQHQAGP